MGHRCSQMRGSCGSPVAWASRPRAFHLCPSVFICGQMSIPDNPFDPTIDPDRHTIWHILIAEDSLAFVNSDWPRVAPHFDEHDFEGIRCADSPDPDRWALAFAHLENYRDDWLQAARQFRALQFKNHTPAEALLSRCSLTRIDLLGDRALAHKKFHGSLPLQDGNQYAPGHRQTLYRLRKQQGLWKITGFLGRLPLLNA